MIQCNKNLVPAIIEKEKIIEICIKNHVADSRTYQVINFYSLSAIFNQLKFDINVWTDKYDNRLLPKGKKI